VLGRLARRVFAIFCLLILIFLAVKGVLRILPGDPVDAILAETGANLDPEVLRHTLGLDRPFLAATAVQLAAIFRSFDWGTSLVRREAIGPLLRERAASSLLLGGVAISGALAFSFAMAFLAELPSRASVPLRHGIRLFSALAVALPTAWFGPILGFLLAVEARIFALSGGIALPALTLGLGLSGFWLRAFSETLGREMRGDVVRTARAKGLGEWAVIWKHGFIPAAGPLAAYLGSQTGALFAGAVITETIFDRPGLGSLLVEAIFKRDYPLIEGTLILTAVFILFGNFFGDLLQEMIQPKLRETP
jgi:peptide/nickel transport system permease protein